MLARRCGATLELFICDFDPSLSGQPFFDTDKLRQLREEFVSERLEYLEDDRAVAQFLFRYGHLCGTETRPCGLFCVG